MQHSDFVAYLDADSHFWGVKRLRPAVRAAFGVGGVRRLNFELIMVLIPSLGLAVCAVVTSHYGLFVWSAFSVLGFLYGNPGPSMIGMIPNLLLAVIGVGISFHYGRFHVVGGILPGVTWFTTCAIIGGTMQLIEGELRRSPELLEKLEREDNLLLIPKTLQTRPPE
ncbi:MAG: hypothetical protein HZA46_08305 [Planctomycetales bacterium]|nr:hypothetical protein [Planctomycetales bacterium]